MPTRITLLALATCNLAPESAKCKMVCQCSGSSITFISFYELFLSVSRDGMAK